jgi:anhydro-N-acetylmuramic acid kinase
MRVSGLAKKKDLYVVGIMNGTSIDAIDYVYCKISRTGTGKSSKLKIAYLAEDCFPFEANFRERIKKAAEHKLNVAEISLLNHELGRKYVEQLKSIVKKKKWKIDAIGLHGQTVFHSPPNATWQIGEASYLSAHFEVPVISDFRTADLAVGGQGAPIASLFHRLAFQSLFPKQAVSLHNLGGISNLSWMNDKGDVERAFDTGPANILMDLFISDVSHGQLKFDENGYFASKGIPAISVVENLVTEHPYFREKPPKSCGREEFGTEYLEQTLKKLGPLIPEDKMATLAELTAKSIALSYEKYCPKMPGAIVLCGGGAKNNYLKKRIQYNLPQTKILTTEDFGWPVSSIEGAAFALLAAFRIWEMPANLPKTTGAKKSVVLGKITEVF